MSTSDLLPRACARTTLAALGVLVLLGLGACGDDTGSSADQPPASAPSTTGASTSSTSSSDPAPEPTETSEASQVIAYAGGEAVPPLITSVADARKLTDTSMEFQQFIGRAGAKVARTADCDGAAVGVSVDAYSTAGYAVGGVNECGGYAAMWAQVNGTWQEIQGTQDTWDCAVLKKYAVPSDLLLGRQTCYDYDGDHQEHPYHQA